MDNRLLEIVIISAKDLNNVKHITTMDVYLEAAISGDPNSKQTTPVAKDGGKKPTWNFPMRFSVNTAAEALKRNRPVLLLKLRCARTIRGDKDIGEAQVPIEDLLALSGSDTCTRNVSYPVLIPSGKPQGAVNFSFKFVPEGGPSLPRDGNYPPIGIPYVAPASVPPYKQSPPLGYPPVGQSPPLVVQPQPAVVQSQTPVVQPHPQPPVVEPQLEAGIDGDGYIYLEALPPELLGAFLAEMMLNQMATDAVNADR